MNANDFFERYNSDVEFREKVKAMTQTLKGNGAENLFAAVVKVAESLGYAVTEDEVRAYRTAQNGELSDELLGNVAGGMNFMPCSCCIKE